MLLRALRPLRAIVDAIADEACARRIALGFAFGAMLGLLPKGNLTAVAVIVVLLSSQASLLAAAVGTVVFTLISPWMDPLAHRFGWALLNSDAARNVGPRLFDLPLAPWTALNNTVVMGSLLLGLLLFYPMYWCAWGACERIFGPRRVR